MTASDVRKFLRAKGTVAWVKVPPAELNWLPVHKTALLLALRGITPGAEVDAYIEGIILYIDPKRLRRSGSELQRGGDR